nr:hypothetical protein Iba_chr14aCG7610 [Ipomoea batatas]
MAFKTLNLQSQISNRMRKLNASTIIWGKRKFLVQEKDPSSALISFLIHAVDLDCRGSRILGFRVFKGVWTYRRFCWGEGLTSRNQRGDGQ